MSGPENADRDEDPTFPEEHEGGDLIGVESRGSPIYYDEDAHSAFEARVDDGVRPGRANERQLEEGATVGDLIDDVRDRSGWDWLSERAKEYVPGAESDSEDR